MLNVFSAIEVFLGISGYKNGIPDIPRMSKKDSETYYYSPRKFTAELLRQDQDDYAKKRKNFKVARRVAFMVASDSDEANKEGIIEFYDARVAHLFAEKHYTIVIIEYEAEQNVRSEVHCEVVTTEEKQNNQRVLDLVDPILRTVFSQSKQCKRTISNFPKQNGIEVLLAEVIQLKLNGDSNDFTVPETAKRYHSACIATLGIFLTLVQDEQAIESITTLVKYNKLLHERPSHNALPPNIEALEAIRYSNLLLKKAIYRLSLPNIQDPFKEFMLSELVTLLRNRLDHEVWLKDITALRKKKLLGLRAGEAILPSTLERIIKNNWLAYLQWQGKRLLNHIYEHSFMGLSSELSKRMTANILKAKWASERLTEMQSAKITVMAKYIGLLVGCYLTAISGRYFLLRVLGTNFLAEQLKLRLSEETCDDERGQVIPVHPILQLVNFIHLAQILVASAESLYERDPIYLVRALGGLLGSYMAMQITANAISKSNATEENKQSTRLLLAIWGYIAGYLLSGLVYSRVEKIPTRTKFKEQFCGPIKGSADRSCEVNPKQSVNSYSFWANSYDEVGVRLTERDPAEATIYEVDCRIEKLENGKFFVVYGNPEMVKVPRNRLK